MTLERERNEYGFRSLVGPFVFSHKQAEVNNAMKRKQQRQGRRGESIKDIHSEEGRLANPKADRVKVFAADQSQMLPGRGSKILLMSFMDGPKVASD